MHTDEHERRLAALVRFLDEYEAEHEEITEDEVNAAVRRLRDRAVVVRRPDSSSPVHRL